MIPNFMEVETKRGTTSRTGFFGFLHSDLHNIHIIGTRLILKGVKAKVEGIQINLLYDNKFHPFLRVRFSNGHIVTFVYDYNSERKLLF
jgi:hypothetical protein